MPTVVAHFAALGMTEVAVYLVDLDQRLLVPLGGESAPADQLDIDGTLPGRVFRTKQVLDEPAQPGPGTRLWVPLVDGADRLGVLGVTVATADADTVRRAQNLTTLTAGWWCRRAVTGTISCWPAGCGTWTWRRTALVHAPSADLHQRPGGGVRDARAGL